MPSPPPTTKRVRLTHQQKTALLDHYIEHPGMLQEDACSWVAARFALERAPATSTLRALVKRGKHTGDTSPPHQKTKLAVVSNALEQELVAWVASCERLRLPVASGAAMMAKAAQIRNRLDRDGKCSAQLKAISFSSGWLDKLKKRHGIKARKLHDEASSSNGVVVEKGRAALKEATKAYNKQDVFNLEETVFLFCSAPTQTHATTSYPGIKQSKKRVTVVVTSNADGSTQVPLLFVGTARQPYCFQRSSAAELGVDYMHSAKGWTTSELFKSWLLRFDAAMRDEQRHVLLLLDNASCHRVNVDLSNVKLLMLPPNATAHLQPQDAGVIKALKSRISAVKNRCIVNKIDNLTQSIDEIGEKEAVQLAKSLYEIDVLVAIRWAQTAWAEVSRETISNCWAHTAILDEDSYELEDCIRRLSLTN